MRRDSFHAYGLITALVVSALAIFAIPAAATTLVYLNQPDIAPHPQPSAFRLADYSSSDFRTAVNSQLSAVTWSSWGEPTAQGTGQALIQWTDASTGLHHQDRATVPVIVTAGNRATCGGVTVYTSLEIQIADGATTPPHFALVQRDDKVLPCKVHGGGPGAAASPEYSSSQQYVAGDQEEKSDPRGCLFQGISEKIIRSPFSVSYCAMRWKSWGAATTTGRGVARIGFRQYGIRVHLYRVRWCSRWSVSYTRETAEIWGSGTTISGQGNVSRSEVSRLTELIGRAGQPHSTFHESAPPDAQCAA
jgi:hypothetical protein